MCAFHQLPPEILYQIALHLPLTTDVLALSLTNSSIRGALSTPALFKARLALQGWDVSAWKEEEDSAQSPGDFRRWMHIDHTYCRIAQLFDEATPDGFFHTTFIPGPHDCPYKDVQWEARSDPGSDPGGDNGRPDSRRVYDGKRSVNWLQKLSGILPLFVTHHRTTFPLLPFRILIYTWNAHFCFSQAEETSGASPKQNITMYSALMRRSQIASAPSSGT
jgi:hypothetical protein